MIKILYINHVSKISGAETSLLNLLKRLNRAQYTPIVACPVEGLLPRELNRLKIQTEFLDFIRFKRTFNIFILTAFLFRYFCVLWRLVRLIAKHRIKLVHSNSTNAHIYGVVVARSRRIPSVWSVRDIVPLGLLGKLLFCHSSRIITVSQAVAKDIGKYVQNKSGKNKHKLRIIYNGVDVELFSVHRKDTNVRERLGVANNKFLVGMISQMVPWKRHSDFLEAIAKAVKNHPNIMALVVGDDVFEDQQRYKASIVKLCQRLGLKDKVIFTGYRHDMPEVLAALDLLVVPSEREPFGRVIIEAMACSRPVVATNSGGIPEIIHDGTNGLLVPVGDIDAIAEAIIKVAKDPTLAKELSFAGRRTVTRDLTIENNVIETEGIYAELVMNR